MTKYKFILTGNASYENRGCEAIARGTVKILDNVFGRDNKYIFESRFETIESYHNQQTNEYDQRVKHVKFTKRNKKFIERLTLKSLAGKISYKLKIFGYFEDLNMQKRQHLEIMEDLKDCTAALCVGGDNYSLDYGYPKRFTDTDDVIKSYKKPCIIWGASIGPFTKYPGFEKCMARHLRKLDAILVREDCSLEYLNNIGVKDNVYRVSDPAFVMDPIKPADYDKLADLENSIGINLSPLMARYWTGENIDQWTEFCIRLIRQVSRKINKPIYLVPHVVLNERNNDYLFLKKIKDNIDDSKERIFLLDPIYSAAETKYIISKMAGFMGSRMHATIAAFSTLIPTVSMAYSIKALGLNREVFGDLSYCITKDHLNNIDYIVDLLDTTIQDTKNIKSLMSNNIPKIRENAEKAGYILKNIIS